MARTDVRRKPERARYDPGTVHAILDEALYCHVGVVRDGGPVVIPTIHARDGDRLYLHGSPAAGIVRDGRGGADLCVTATIVDALVLSRTSRNHSMNYRSVVVFGRAERVRDPEAKLRALEVIIERVTPGRWSHLRPVTEEELREVEVLSIPLTEASAKVRTGQPLDSDGDRALPIWAGVLPLGISVGGPVPDDAVPNGLDPPDHVANWTR